MLRNMNCYNISPQNNLLDLTSELWRKFYNNNNNNNIFISYIEYTNITPPANSKANRGGWCVNGARLLQVVGVKKVPYL